MGSLPFTSADGLIRVPVRIWGIGRPPSTLSFVLGTGTPRTLVDVEAARHLGFLPERAVRRSRVLSAIGAEEGYVVVAPHIRGLGWERDDFEIACHRLGATAQVDGLLGADFLSRLRLVIDYGAGLVELSDSVVSQGSG